MPNPWGTPVIGDLVASQQRLEVYCHNDVCRHHVTLEPLDACLLLGEETTFEDAQRRLTCSRCKVKGREGWITVQASMQDYYERLREKGYTVPVRPASGTSTSAPSGPIARRPTPRR
jgi:anti-sigma-K factor RskA